MKGGDDVDQDKYVHTRISGNSKLETFSLGVSAFAITIYSSEMSMLENWSTRNRFVHSPVDAFHTRI